MPDPPAPSLGLDTFAVIFVRLSPQPRVCGASPHRAQGSRYFRPVTILHVGSRRRHARLRPFQEPALAHGCRRIHDVGQLVPAGPAARPWRGHFFPRHARRTRDQARGIVCRRAEPVPARKAHISPPSHKSILAGSLMRCARNAAGPIALFAPALAFRLPTGRRCGTAGGPDA